MNTRLSAGPRSGAPRASSALKLALCLALAPQLAFSQAPGTIDLSPTPPEISSGVAPNLALTFDDSGSMGWQYMPDDRPYETPPAASTVDWAQSTAINTTTTAPWFCAGRIDARVTDPANPRSKPMNGMFYDPNVVYRLPLNADGVTEFPAPTFTDAWDDGIARNRPTNPDLTVTTKNLATSNYCRSNQPAADVTYYQLEGGTYSENWSDTGGITTSGTANWPGYPFFNGYRGNSSITAGTNPGTLIAFGSTTKDVKANNTTPSVTTLIGGVYEVQGGTEIGGNPTIALQSDGVSGTGGSRQPALILRVNTVNCTNVRVAYKLRDLDTLSTATQPIALQARRGATGNFTNIPAAYVSDANVGSNTDITAAIGSAFDQQAKVEIRWITADASGTNDAMIGIDDIVVTGTCAESGRAGYWQLKAGLTTDLAQDSFGRITNGTAVLYTAANWEFVDLPASQQQNFANWYSYYRTRVNSAKTAMSRAFAPFDESIRLVYQNLGNNVAENGPNLIKGTTPIYKFKDVPAVNARTNFYNWLFNLIVSDGTPNIPASVRVGEFFTGAGGLVNTNPYYDLDLGRELSCRQNFHINMSDGYWNQANTPQPSNPSKRYLKTDISPLPDGKTYDTSVAQTSFFNEFSGTELKPILADVMFHYWATDLRPDFALNESTRLKVPPFLPDRSTTLFNVPLAAGADPRSNSEIYWNPANDPASWPHLVNFNISFGLDGILPQTDDVYRQLRLGSATYQWPYPDCVDNACDNGKKLDDFWHAALVSRGRFLNAKNPEQLVSALQDIIANIIARRGASTAVSVSLPIITDGTTGYTAGYDTSDWSGFVTRNRLDANTAQRLDILWDAGCNLTGGACASTAQSGLPVRNPNTRVIITSDGMPGTGKPFRWSSLSTAQQARLNLDPTTISLLTDSGTPDAFGQNRVDYLRGSRVNETTVSPRFRVRGSVLGAVIRGQPIYVSSPASGFDDAYPAGSPEDIAANANHGYRDYLVAQRNRRPTIYVAANDGMLHAFDAGGSGVTGGTERWAYVPNAVIRNMRLTKSTQFESGFTPLVDDKPVIGDAFINSQWRTVLVGSLRLGGRGVYALDITSAESPASEASVQPKVLWEFTNVPPEGYVGTDCGVGSRYCSALGYTYDAVNIARLKYNNKWVALVSSGYFPKIGTDPASLSTAAAQTSLLVIDLATGTLIRKIDTSTAPQAASASFGMSQAIVYDVGSDLIDDVAIAGDLAGNLWRFDLSGDTTASWKVDLMFRSYGNGGTTNPGDQAISSAPVTMKDRTLGLPMVVFGTGKFLGTTDRTTVISVQSHYGIRDYGTCSPTNSTACTNYPIKVNELITQVMVQDGSARRSITTNNPIPATKRGWRIQMNVAAEPGERAYATAFPFYTANAVLLRSIIPKGLDPCDPGARYGLIVVDAADGTALTDLNNSGPAPYVGAVVQSSTPPGDPITLRGGGAVVIAGLTERDGVGAIVNQAAIDAITGSLSRADDIWHRGAWRDLQQE